MFRKAKALKAKLEAMNQAYDKQIIETAKQKHLYEEINRTLSACLKETGRLKAKISSLERQCERYYNERMVNRARITELTSILEKSPVKLSQLPVNEVRGSVAASAWDGDHKNAERIYTDLEGNPIIGFRGHTYEPSYESFSATCSVYGYVKGNKICLFDEEDYSAGAYCHKVKTTGSNETIEEYIKKYDCYVIRKNKQTD